MVQGSMFNQFMYAGQTVAYATAATRTVELPRVQSFSQEDENNIIYDRGLGEGANVSNQYLGPYDTGFTIRSFVTDFDFLKYWVGPKTGAGTSGDPYVLTEATSVALNTSNLQPFTFEAINTTESTKNGQIFIGCVGDEFTLSGDINSRLALSAHVIARHSEPISSPTAYTADTTAAYVMINGTWKWGSTPSTISGVQGFSLTHRYEHEWRDNRDIDGRFIAQPYIAPRTYTGSIRIKMATALATTVIADFYNTASGAPEDGSTMVTPTTNLEFKIELVNGSREATIWLDHCSIDRIRRPVNIGGGIVQLTFEFQARSGKGNEPIKWWST